MGPQRKAASMDIMMRPLLVGSKTKRTVYQPPKFQQFDKKRNPKKHVIHFVETYNNAGIKGDLIIKKFVRSLRGNAFGWYTDIEPESIDCWETMERDFLNRFYSTHQSVRTMELRSTNHWKDEPIVDYMNKWCYLV
ncbi:hypothetical protein RJ640_018237 [Escallonia rubra]|uniref:Retrotransposon gag domain-containing protein n=1 Tax=Escallonia rubra TaxID=112253 RepID=A0AA88U1Y1_9ASTE|nr:hypothetical protein RJ640_018237 [Escallonia rubra]